jgi:hypothetical protein
MRRLWLVAAMAACVALGSMASALADDFEDLLDAAGEADYAGRQIVVTFFDGSTALDIVEIEHAGSMMMVSAEGSDSMIGAGRLSAGDGDGLSVSSWTSMQLSDRYEVGPLNETKRLGRTASSIEILEDGRRRMRLVFDNTTGAPLVTEVYNGDGKLFRLRSLLEVDEVPHRIYSSPGHLSDEFEVLVPTARHSMPAAAAGYQLADVYAGPDDSLQGFYSDGLFSFSVFTVDGSADFNRFADATVVEVQGLKYRRLVSPGEIWVTWKSAGTTFVLVGDLPPDHLDGVLSELPKPGRRNLFSRLWSGLFG